MDCTDFYFIILQSRNACPLQTPSVTHGEKCFLNVDCLFPLENMNTDNSLPVIQ